MIANKAIEYIGELLPDGHLSVPQDVIDLFESGQKIKIRMEPCVLKNHEGDRCLSFETEEFLAFIKKEPHIGGFSQMEITREFIHDREC